jgi:hypothetical protein
MAMRVARRNRIQLMIGRATQALRLLTACLVLRRAVLVICALALVSVTTAHAAQHLDCH